MQDNRQSKKSRNYALRFINCKPYNALIEHMHNGKHVKDIIKSSNNNGIRDIKKCVKNYNDSIKRRRGRVCKYNEYGVYKYGRIITLNNKLYMDKLPDQPNGFIYCLNDGKMYGFKYECAGYQLNPLNIGTIVCFIPLIENGIDMKIATNIVERRFIIFKNEVNNILMNGDITKMIVNPKSQYYIRNCVLFDDTDVDNIYVWYPDFFIKPENIFVKIDVFINALVNSGKGGNAYIGIDSKSKKVFGQYFNNPRKFYDNILLDYVNNVLRQWKTSKEFIVRTLSRIINIDFVDIIEFEKNIGIDGINMFSPEPISQLKNATYVPNGDILSNKALVVPELKILKLSIGVLTGKDKKQFFTSKNIKYVYENGNIYSYKDNYERQLYDYEYRTFPQPVTIDLTEVNDNDSDMNMNDISNKNSNNNNNNNNNNYNGNNIPIVNDSTMILPNRITIDIDDESSGGSIYSGSDMDTNDSKDDITDDMKSLDLDIKNMYRAYDTTKNIFQECPHAAMISNLNKNTRFNRNQYHIIPPNVLKLSHQNILQSNVNIDKQNEQIFYPPELENEN